VKTNTGRHGTALSLYRLAFDDVVSDLLKVKPADTSERAGQRAEFAGLPIVGRGPLAAMFPGGLTRNS